MSEKLEKGKKTLGFLGWALGISYNNNCGLFLFERQLVLQCMRYLSDFTMYYLSAFYQTVGRKDQGMPGMDQGLLCGKYSTAQI